MEVRGSGKAGGGREGDKAWGSTCAFCDSSGTARLCHPLLNPSNYVVNDAVYSRES